MSPNPQYPNIPSEGYPYPPQPGGPASSNYPPQPAAVQGPGHQGAYPQQSVGAPGGYPAAPAGAPPGAEKPLKQPEAAAPAGYIAPAGQGTGAQPPSGYPGSHAPPIQPYSPQHAQHVTGYPVGASAANGGAAGMHVASAPGSAEDTRRCGCSVGWVLFAIGFIFPISWIAAVFLPLCTKNRFDRLAAMASVVFFVVYLAIALATSLTMSNRGHGGYYYYG